MCARNKEQSTLNGKEGMSERAEKGQTTKIFRAQIIALEAWSQWFIWEDLEKLECFFFFNQRVTQSGTVETLIWQRYQKVFGNCKALNHLIIMYMRLI